MRRTPQLLSRASRIESLERRALLSLTPAGSEFPVNTYTFEFQDAPAVAMDADGDFVVAWQSFGQEAGKYGLPDLGVYAQRYDAAGVPRGDEFRVNTTTTNAQGSPAVAMDNSGDFVVVWGGNGPGDSYGIHAQRFNAAGVRQGGEFRVNTAITLTQSAPTVAMDADGDFVVAWNSGGYGFGYRIVAQRFNASGVEQGGEIQANATTSTHKERPDVAMDDAGNFVVTWESRGQDGGDQYGVYARRYDAAGAAQGGEFLVNTFTTGDQWFPAVAMDADGDFAITWTSTNQDGSAFGVYAQRYNATGVAQGVESLVNQATTSSQSRSDVAMDADGDFVVTWQGYIQATAGYEVYLRTFSAAGVPRQHELRVNTTLPSSQSEVAVALDADGKAVVAWQGLDGPSAGIFARRLVEGVPPPSHIAGEFRVNTHTTGGQGFPSAATDAAGNFVIVWESEDQDGSDYGIYAQRYNAAGAAQGPEFRVNTSTLDYQYDPEVAMDADGDFVVVWTHGYTYGSEVIARRFNAAGAAQGDEFLVNTFTTDRQIRGAVAMDADGDFVISWESFQEPDLGGWGVYAQRYNAAGAPQGDEFHVNTFTPALQFDSSVAMDAAGNFVIVWQNATIPESTRSVFGQRYNAAGVPQGEEFRVNADTTGRYSDPSVAMDVDGDFAVAFAGRAGADNDVFARRYDETGAALGAEFRVNTFTTNPQQRAAVAMRADGGFVVAWESHSQDTANFHSMYAQAYDAGGQPFGGEFRASTNPIKPPPNNLVEHTMAMDADGDFVIAWANHGRDGSSYGVYAQRFAAPSAQTAAPAVNASSFVFQTAPHRLRFTFSDNVFASLGTDDLVLENLTTQQTIPPGDLTLSYDAATNTATFTYTESGGALPDGRYRATLLASGITNPGGTPLAGNHVFAFFFLRADANHDARVNLQDFNILAGNFGQSPRDFSQGDFNYDGTVNLQDFNLLAGRFGVAIGPDAVKRSERSGADQTDRLRALLEELA